MSALHLIQGHPWLITPDALETIIDIATRERLSEDAIKALEAEYGKEFDNSHGATIRDGVGIIPITGPIMRHAGLFSRISGATSTDMIAKDLKMLGDNDKVHSIILNMDTPGGEGMGIQELATQIRDTDKRKPVCVYVDGLCASAGYWLASGARHITAAPTSLNGSIGVVMSYTDRKKFDDKMGIVRGDIISSQSPKKRPDPTTDSGRAYYQSIVDDMGEEFVASVAKHRGYDAEHVLAKFGQGGVMIAKKAMKAGMVDAIGHFEPLLARMANGDYPSKGGNRKGASMSGTSNWKTNLVKAIFGASDEDGELEANDGTTPKVVVVKEPVAKASAGSEEMKALQAEIAQLKAKQSDERIKFLAMEAKTECDRLYRAGKMSKAEFDRMHVSMVFAALDDAGITNVDTQTLALALGLDRNSAVLAMSRKERLVNSFEMRSGNRVTEEVLAKGETFNLAQEPEVSGSDDEYEAAIARRHERLEHKHSRNGNGKS